MKIIQKLVGTIFTKSGASDAINNQAKHINAMRVKVKQLEDHFSNMDKMIILLQHNNKMLENRLMGHIDLVNSLDEANASLTERLDEFEQRYNRPLAAFAVEGKNVPHEVTRAAGLISVYEMKRKDKAKDAKEIEEAMEKVRSSMDDQMMTHVDMKSIKNYQPLFDQRLDELTFYNHPPVQGRLMNLFAKHELIFVGDLCAVEKGDLRSRFPGINQNFIKRIKEVLGMCQLSFGMPEAKFWKHQTKKI